MFTSEYEEVPAYYAGKRVWVEFEEGGEKVISLAEETLPGQETWTTGLWALVTVDAFRYFRSNRTSDGEYHVKLSSPVVRFRGEWFYLGDSLREDLLEIVEQAHAAE